MEYLKGISRPHASGGGEGGGGGGGGEGGGGEGGGEVSTNKSSLSLTST